MTQRKVSLTGIKPTGAPHIGNYLGMFKPALELTREYDAYYFIADYHALTTMRDREEFRHSVYEVAAAWLACGLDPQKTLLYRQSDVPEVFELNWILSCVTPKGLLNRAHAYKAAVDANEAAGNLPDDGVVMGLYNYPILMAADILVVDANVVPVGQDQKQHIEITRDIAIAFNAIYGDVLTVPDGVIQPEVAIITGLDGRKMSKSYGNQIPFLADSAQLRKTVMRIVTDSRTPEEPKDPDADNIYSIFKHFAAPERLEEVRNLYLSGGLAYGKMKQELYETLDAAFSGARAIFNDLMGDPSKIEAILASGAERARETTQRMMARVRGAIGKTTVPVAVR